MRMKLKKMRSGSKYWKQGSTTHDLPISHKYRTWIRILSCKREKKRRSDGKNKTHFLVLL